MQRGFGYPAELVEDRGRAADVGLRERELPGSLRQCQLADVFADPPLVFLASQEAFLCPMRQPGQLMMFETFRVDLLCLRPSKPIA